MRGLCTNQAELTQLVVARLLMAQGGQLRRRPPGHVLVPLDQLQLGLRVALQVLGQTCSLVRWRIVMRGPAPERMQPVRPAAHLVPAQLPLRPLVQRQSAGQLLGPLHAVLG